MTIDWITTEDAGRKWGIKARQVQALCADGKMRERLKWDTRGADSQGRAKTG
jgi:hypothetical protein